jgi:hypothetical protein
LFDAKNPFFNICLHASEEFFGHPLIIKWFPFVSINLVGLFMRGMIPSYIVTAHMGSVTDFPPHTDPSFVRRESIELVLRCQEKRIH